MAILGPIEGDPELDPRDRLLVIVLGTCIHGGSEPDLITVSEGLGFVKLNEM